MSTTGRGELERVSTHLLGDGEQKYVRARLTNESIDLERGETSLKDGELVYEPEERLETTYGSREEAWDVYQDIKDQSIGPKADLEDLI